MHQAEVAGPAAAAVEPWFRVSSCERDVVAVLLEWLLKFGALTSWTKAARREHAGV